MPYKMKQLFYLVLALALGACQPHKTDSELSIMKAEVISIHDEAMDQMGQTMKLKRELKQLMDSSQVADFNQAMADLDQAHEGMMVWMRNFSRQFPNATLKGAGHDHHQSSGQSNVTKELTPGDELKLLKNEKMKVLVLREETIKAISQAEKLLNIE